MGKYRKLDRSPGVAWRVGAPILKPLLVMLGRRAWRHGERIPHHGGAILAINHISHIDPLMSGLLVWDYGRIPRFIAKSSLFGHSRVLDWWLTQGGQVPVDRSAGAEGFQAAMDVVGAGDLLIVYIEGSITKDPDGWPMRPKTGAARIALETGAPVIPVGQWGAQELLPAYSKKLSLRRPKIQFSVGDPVDLDDLRGRADDPEAVRDATSRIMAAVVSLVEELREERAPIVRYDPARHGVPATGDAREG